MQLKASRYLGFSPCTINLGKKAGRTRNNPAITDQVEENRKENWYYREGPPGEHRVRSAELHAVKEPIANW